MAVQILRIASILSSRFYVQKTSCSVLSDERSMWSCVVLCHNLCIGIVEMFLFYEMRHEVCLDYSRGSTWFALGQCSMRPRQALYQTELIPD